MDQGPAKAFGRLKVKTLLSSGNLNARIEDGILRVVSADFQRLEVPIFKIKDCAVGIESQAKL